MSDSSVTIPVGNKSTIISRVFWFWVIAEVVLFCLDVVFNYGRLINVGAIRRLCNMAREDGIGTWVSSLQMLFVGITVWIIGMRYQATSSEPAWKAKMWKFLACFFAYLATDDAASIHERMGTTFEKLAKRGGSGGLASEILAAFPSYPWQVLFMPIFGTVAVFMATFLVLEIIERGRYSFGELWGEIWTTRVITRGLRHLRDELSQPKSRVLWFFAGGFFFSAFAIFLDFIEGKDGAQDWIVSALDVSNYTVRHFLKIIEEDMEMFGITLFFVGFLKILLRDASRVELHLPKK